MNKMKELQKLLARIPKGKVTTYKILAEKLGLNPRHVGRLLSQNPYPVKYPCYKVVRSNGELGGYSSDNGVIEKIERLRKDGLEVSNKRIELNKFLFNF